MENVITLILRGCKLAKDLESNLPNLANQQQQQQEEVLSKFCDDISKVFATARDRLSALHHPQDPTSHPHMMATFSRELRESQQPQIDPSLLQQWMRNIGHPSSAMELLKSQLIAPRGVSSSSGFLALGTATGKHIVQTSADYATTDSGINISSGSSSSLRPRRRKDDAEKRTVRVPAPTIGNTEIPPEDGFTWRKYGQKEILGSKFPRSYYRCTHQKLYNCPAKKQVQRLDDEPHIFEVTYRSDHTCHESATAPSIPPPPPPEIITQDMPQTATTQPPPPLPPPPFAPTTSLRGWLDFSLGAGPSSSAGAGPSTVRYGNREGEYPVADLADTMFNSGSSSTNSMEFIFTPPEDKWETGDKKN